MEPLIVKMTEESPAIILNPDKGKFQLVGRSWPENANKFFGQIFSWFKEYFANQPLEETVFEIRLTYFNTATSKQLIRLLFFLKDYSSKHKVRIKWYLTKDDEEMQHEAKRFEQIIKFPIEIHYMEKAEARK